MRKIPGPHEQALNTNDHLNSNGSLRPYRKPFYSTNQHYITHNIILPEKYEIPEMNREQANRNAHSGLRNR